MRTRGWYAAWALLTLLSVGVAGYALTLFALPGARPPFLASSPYPWAVVTHLLCGGIALALGPWQFLTGPRARRGPSHRWIGRAYGLAILLGGSSGLLMSTVSMGGWTGHSGFFLLASGWLLTTAIAVRAARLGDISTHRRWMVRSFAFTFAAVTLRLWLPASAIAGIPFASAYPVVAWLCWIPNVMAAEWLLRQRTVIASPVVSV